MKTQNRDHEYFEAMNCNIQSIRYYKGLILNSLNSPRTILRNVSTSNQVRNA